MIGLWVNPNSGNRQGVIWAHHILSKDKDTIRITDADHYKFLLTHGQIHEIWIIGGDGTLHHFLNHVDIPNIPFSILPAGTGNDLFRTTGMPKSLKRWLNKWPESVVETRDLAQCQHFFFHNCCGVGFDAAVGSALQQMRHASSTSMGYLKIVFEKLSKFQGRQPFSSTHLKQKSAFLLNINIGQFIGGGFKITPQASPTDGLLDICLIPPVKKWKRWIYLPFLATGNHLHFPWIEYKKLPDFAIQFPDKIPVQMDGELYEMDQLQIKIAEKKLKIRVLSN